LNAEEIKELLRLLRGRLPSRDELAAIRQRRVRSLVRHAYERVPYYRRLFDGAGVRPEDIRTVEDLRHVPISTREQLRGAGADGFARGVDPKSGVMGRTSGSTGRPWSVFRTRGENRVRRALDFRSMRHAGVRPTDVVATLGPVRAVDRPLAKLGIYRTVHVSPYLPIDEQIERLRSIQPTVLWIYPSALRALLTRTGSLAAVARPRMLITAAEPFDAVLRRRVTDERPIETRNFYGAVEVGRIAWECAAGEGLHINADSNILELADKAGVAGAARPVVITSLYARAMPILRYRLDDLCELIDGACSCGVALPLMRAPAGRDWDLMELPSGRLVPPWGLSARLVRIPELLQYRVIQKSLDRLVIELLCRPAPAPETIANVRAQIEEHLAEPVRIDFELVDRIDDSAAKHRVYVSELRPRSPAAAPTSA
jgi:phenylacetate-CoA ligase